MIYLARVLGVEAFGIFSFGHMLAGYFWLAIDLGLNMYGAREVAKRQEDPTDLLNTILSIRITSGIIIFIVFHVLLFFFELSTVHRSVYIGFSFYLISRSLFTEWYLRGIEKFNYIAIGNFVTFGVLLAALFLLVDNADHVARSSLIWSLSFLIGGLVFLCLTVISSPRVRLRIEFQPRKWIFHLRESIHFVFSAGLSTLVQQMPLLLIGIVASDYDVGLYSSAHRLVFGIIFLFSICFVIYST